MPCCLFGRGWPRACGKSVREAALWEKFLRVIKMKFSCELFPVLRFSEQFNLMLSKAELTTDDWGLLQWAHCRNGVHHIAHRWPPVLLFGRDFSAHPPSLGMWKQLRPREKTRPPCAHFCEGPSQLGRWSTPLWKSPSQDILRKCVILYKYA